MTKKFSTTHSISVEDNLIQYVNRKQVNSNKFLTCLSFFSNNWFSFLSLDKNIGYIVNVVNDIMHDYQFFIFEHNILSLERQCIIFRNTIYILHK